VLATCGGDRYSIPQDSLLELPRLPPDQSPGIETVQGAPVYRLRGRLLPLLYLSRELQLPGSADPRSLQLSAVNIIVLQADGRPFGLVVDEINDTEEIVVKPLGKELKDGRTFSGATILGDGKVALILDAAGIAQLANLTGKSLGTAERAPSEPESTANLQSLLLFQAGKNGRMVVPLSQVARLEEIERTAIENAGQHAVVQYRGQIMPLIQVSELMDQP
jgi:two-component system chemotaxis sensor kinase CheA